MNKPPDYFEIRWKRQKIAGITTVILFSAFWITVTVVPILVVAHFVLKYW